MGEVGGREAVGREEEEGFRRKEEEEGFRRKGRGEGLGGSRGSGGQWQDGASELSRHDDSCWGAQWQEAARSLDAEEAAKAAEGCEGRSEAGCEGR